MLKQEKYKLSDNMTDILYEYFINEKKKENFSNARCVRNLFEKLKFEQANRVATTENEDINIIKKVDLNNVLALLFQESSKPITRKIGF